ncbi:MAG: hypothetical protein ACHRXM_06750 [Isosphaerales bacterium]
MGTQTIQKTGKMWKLLSALSILAMFVGFCRIAATWGDPTPRHAAQGAMIVAWSLGGLLVAKIGA